MPRYRLAIFDFDGTLADSLSWSLGAFNRAAVRYRFRGVEEADLETLRDYEARQIVRHLEIPTWKLPLVTRFLRREMAREIGAISLFAGVDAVLEQLAGRGVKLAIVTSNSEENVRRVLGARHASLIGEYRCGVSIFGKGPKLRRVLAASGVPPGEALCIGDEIRDLHAARAARIPFGAVAWGYTRLESLAAHAPREVFTRVEEIVDRVA